ncbi:MAG: D-tagatose 3-epimerase [Thermofilum sp. ex4484_79]|nr:MAG: D-tagatose 3-epimerase [Thermofilum sp. ex4484_79]
MLFSICNEMFEKWKLEEIFKYVSEIGYHAVEIAPFTLSDDVRKIPSDERKHIHELAEANGIKIAGLHWLLVTPKGMHILSPDESVRKFTKEYLCELIKFNYDIGGKVLVFGSPKQRNVPEGMPYEKAWKLAVEFFRECSKFAEDYDSIIAFEPLARHLTNFINTGREAVKLIQDVNHENFKLILDVYSMTDEGRPYSEIIKEGKDFLAHFHANDTNGLGPGFGKANYTEIIQALREINYNNYLSVEVFDFSPGPKYIASKSIENLRKFTSI